MKYVLIISWLNLSVGGSSAQYKEWTSAVTFQEFDSAKACVFASEEANKLRPANTWKMVCVPKGEVK